MIISHRHRFIFFKTRKTAGTSIEIALSKFCGPEDILSPISYSCEETRRNLGYRSAQNYLKPLREYTPVDYLAWLVTKRKRKKFRCHMSAREIRSKISRHVWNSYFKFCFERNPWDKVISAYYYYTHGMPASQKPSLSAYINKRNIRRFSSYDYYTIRGKVAVDFVGRYENLESDWSSICERFGFEKTELPYTKNDSRPDKTYYRELLTENDKKKIEKYFSREIAYLGYEF